MKLRKQSAFLRLHWQYMMVDLPIFFKSTASTSLHEQFADLVDDCDRSIRLTKVDTEDGRCRPDQTDFGQ